MDHYPFASNPRLLRFSRVRPALAAMALLAMAPALSAAVVFSTLSTAEWNFANALDGTISQQFTVPANESWSLDSITLMLGQGAAGSGTLDVANLAETTVYGTTGSQTTQQLFSFEPLTFSFGSPVTLLPGTYRVRENFGPDGSDVYWDTNTGAGALQMSLAGTITPVPEPAQAAVVGAAVCGLVAGVLRWRGRRSK